MALSFIDFSGDESGHSWSQRGAHDAQGQWSPRDSSPWNPQDAGGDRRWNDRVAGGDQGGWNQRVAQEDARQWDWQHPSDRNQHDRSLFERGQQPEPQNQFDRFGPPTKAHELNLFERRNPDR